MKSLQSKHNMPPPYTFSHNLPISHTYAPQRTRTLFHRIVFIVYAGERDDMCTFSRILVELQWRWWSAGWQYGCVLFSFHIHTLCKHIDIGAPGAHQWIANAHHISLWWPHQALNYDGINSLSRRWLCQCRRLFSGCRDEEDADDAGRVLSCVFKGVV